MFRAEHLHAEFIPLVSVVSVVSVAGGCGETSEMRKGPKVDRHQSFLGSHACSRIQPPRQTLSHAKFRAGRTEIRQNVLRPVSFLPPYRKNYNGKQITRCHLMDGDAVRSVNPYVH
jgi:hypothetical protein